MGLIKIAFIKKNLTLTKLTAHGFVINDAQRRFVSFLFVLNEINFVGRPNKFGGWLDLLFYISTIFCVDRRL